MNKLLVSVFAAQLVARCSCVNFCAGHSMCRDRESILFEFKPFNTECDLAFPQYNLLSKIISSETSR